VLVFACLFRFTILCVFCFSLDCFVLVLFAFVVLGLVSSVLCQYVGLEEHLQNDIFLSGMTNLNSINILFIYFFYKHQRQEAQATYMRVKSITMNIPAINETR